MKIAIFSDSHKIKSGMVATVERENPDVIFHLGDYQSDADVLSQKFPDIPLYSVYGNCDLIQRGEPRIIVELEGKKIFATHGHKYSVKMGLDSVVNTALSAGADILLFGHTHKPMDMEFEGLRIINPGTVGPGGTYGILVIENGEASYQCKSVVL
jgi:hypothetical protein